MAFTPLREAALYLSAIPGLYLMLEGNELVRQIHERRGWRFIGVLEGQNVEDVELRFFQYQTRGDQEPDIEHPPIETKNPAFVPAQNAPTSSIGLFPLES